MAIVSTGQITITDVNDAVSARLSSEFSGVPTNADGSGGDFTGCSTTITINQGVQDVTANGWSITALPSAGVSGTLVGQTYTVTGLSADSGYVDLTATHVNGDVLSKRFTVTKVKKGEAGALITLVPTSQGFFFKDGSPDPSTQTIGFMVIRQNTDAKVTFEASDGVPLLTDEGYLDAAQYADGIYGQGQGDMCYLSVGDFGNRKQVTVTAKAGSLASSVTILRLDESSAEAGATRNVFRGALTYGQAYLVGDTVIADGYGWSCVQAHFSEAANRPPPYPATENTWWALASVKGADTLNAVLSNEAFVFPAGNDGSVSSYVGSGTAIRVYEGADELAYDGVGTSAGTWKVTTAATNITVGSLTDSGTYLTVGQHSGVASGTDTASITYTITGKAKAGADFNLTKVQTFAKSRQGVDGTIGYSALSALLSNEVHVLPAASDGTVSSYANSGTEVRVYEGAVELLYDGVGTSNGTWKVTTAVTNIACGTLTDSGTFLTVGTHSGVAAWTDTSSIVYTITGKSSAGTPFTITKNQTFTKSKAGATGAQGPSVLVTSDRATTFTATDGILDASQTNIVFTAAVSGVASPTYVWSFSGFQTPPTNSGAATQTITAAQFGTAKSAIVTCTVNGTYTDKVTIVRLEKSTAAAGATVGATWGTNISGQPANSIIYNSSVTLAADGTLNGAGGGQVTLPGMGLSSYRVVAAGYTATNKPIGPGLYDAKTGGLLVGMASMYRVVKIHRTTGVLTNVGGWNVLAGGTNSADMAAALNAIGNDHIVVVFTNDEPAGNRLTGGLPAAMYRCGASRGVFGSSSFQGRSAYALIGIAGCGEGNGAEFYQGETYGDANAWIDASFSIIGGNLVGVSGSYTPRTLTDYGYTGALDANNTYVDANGAIQGVSSGSGTAVNNAFLDTLTFTATNVTVSGNTFKKTSGAAAGWDAQAYTKESYTLGAYASFSPDQSTGNSMAGLNTDPATDASYASIDYAVYFNNGTVGIYESSVSQGNFGTYVAGDIFGVTYDGVNVRYYKNGVLLRTVAANISAPLYFDSSISTLNNSISKVKFGPMSSSSWSSIGGTGKPADNATVGAPAGTYVGGVLAETVASNAALASGALQKAGDAIIGPVTFATNGGILAATDADNGVFMGPNGLVGKKAGATTFAIDTAGNASFGGELNAATGTFAGSLSAASGTFNGSLNAATGTFSGTLNASAINAVNTINIAGNAVTIPLQATWVSPWGNDSGTGQRVATASANFDGKPVIILVQLGYGQYYYDSSTQVTIGIYRNGALIKTSPTFTTTTSLGTFMFIDTPPAGTYNYGVGAAAPTSGELLYIATIIAINAKR